MRSDRGAARRGAMKEGHRRGRGVHSHGGVHALQDALAHDLARAGMVAHIGQFFGGVNLSCFS